ncbi:VOC family protein [Glycomyces tarimensis]
MPTSIALGAPIWADAMTSELEKDVEFYKRLFGWEARDFGEESFNYHDFRKDGREVMGLWPAPPDQSPSRTLTLYFHVADCDRSTARAAELGGAVITEPSDVAGSLRYSEIDDPRGARFGLIQPYEDDTGFKAFGEDNAVAWVEYGYDGVPADAMRFYEDLLGWTVTTPPWESPDNPRPYAALRPAGGESEFGGCHGDEVDPERPAEWHPLIRVSDIDLVWTAAASLGGSTIGRPMEAPGSRIGAITAPSGTILSIVQYMDFSV